MRSSKFGTVHIIGAGLAGLAAAVRLHAVASCRHVHEATAYAGGRCRSYHDSATDMLIDNGTHLLLSGNHAALSFVGTIGSSAGLHGPKEAEFPFIDLANGKQWTLRFGESRFPWWVFDKDRRVPQTGLARLSSDRAACLGKGRQADCRRSELLRHALHPFSRAVVTRRAQHCAARRLGQACRRPDQGNHRAWRPGVPPASGARWPGAGLCRAGDFLAAPARRFRCLRR